MVLIIKKLILMRKKQQTAWSTVLQLDAHHAELSFYTTASTLPAPSPSLPLQHVDVVMSCTVAMNKSFAVIVP